MRFVDWVVAVENSRDVVESYEILLVVIKACKGFLTVEFRRQWSFVTGCRYEITPVNHSIAIEVTFFKQIRDFIFGQRESWQMMLPLRMRWCYWCTGVVSLLNLLVMERVGKLVGKWSLVITKVDLVSIIHLYMWPCFKHFLLHSPISLLCPIKECKWLGKILLWNDPIGVQIHGTEHLCQLFLGLSDDKSVSEHCK